MIISPCPAHSSGSMRPLVLQMPTAWRPRTPGHRVWDRSTDALKSPMMMSFSLPSTFQWSDSYSLWKASSHVGSTMNLLVYTLMMVGTLHPWRIVRKDTRRSESLTGRLVSFLASMFFVLHAQRSMLCDWSLFYKALLTDAIFAICFFPVPHRWCGKPLATAGQPGKAWGKLGLNNLF